MKRTLLRFALFPLLAWPASALAQDPVPVRKEPNVLLVVDSSGSMEYKSGSNSYPMCGGVSEKSRWVELVEVLAGTIQDYSCEAIDRRSSQFAIDYSVNGVNPPDTNYRNPYHKPYSDGCAYMPNPAWFARTNAYEWNEPLPRTASGAACASFSPFDGTGILNSFGDLVRFGLMTFDTLPDPGSGIGGGNAPNFSTGVTGAWSYYVGASVTGRPVDCTVPQPMEVGVRNAAAPPWEGRMIPFGDPDADTTTNRARHTRIGQVLLATRPYGATPIAGALDDARDFLWADASADPLDNTKDFGPLEDPYVRGGCREQAVILLTDGEPNLDLRPSCAQTHASDASLNGECPFLLPEEIAGRLATGDGPTSSMYPVKTYVIGFAKTTSDGVYSGSPVNCETMAASEWTSPTGACATNLGDEALQVCCNLHRIASSGHTQRAEFASNKTSLQNKVSEIVSRISSAAVATATQPITTGVGAARSSNPSPLRDAIGFRILTSFTVQPESQNVFRGNLERVRWACQSNVPTLQTKNAAYGDDFAQILGDNKDERFFVSFVADESAGVRYSERSLRPYLPLSVTDGVGTLKGSLVSAKGQTFVSQVNSAALRLGTEVFDNKGTPTTVDDGPCVGLTEAACRDRLMNWVLGYGSGSDRQRCPSSTDCSVLGAIMHSTPVVVDRPSAGISDDTYEKFMADNTSRPMMLYTSSNDGFFHGFMLSPNVATDAPTTMTAPNEWFAFIPPATLTQIWTQYPATQQKLLDGVAVVRDVIASETSGFADYPYKLERDAAAASGGSNTWRTVMIQAFGGGNSGYYALDITNPRVTATSVGPKFLWQVTTDEAGRALFGTNPGKPLITTLLIDGKEVAVAVLPGGYGGSPTSGACTRSFTGPFSNIDSSVAPLATVRCYSGSAATAAMSLTVVRLDSGEIIRTFRRATTSVVPAPLQSRVIPTLFDAPLTGAPAAYPHLPGLVSDRVYIGDQDGTLWKADFSSSDPDDWTMEIFFDAYANYTGTDVELRRKPIALAPMVSVDERSQVTVALATGDQDVGGTTGDRNYVWSLLEARNSANTGFVTVPKWHHEMRDGMHVLGPLQLLGSVLYYTTFQRSTDPFVAACGGGGSILWGGHYQRPFVNSSNVVVAGQGGEAALQLDGSTDKRSSLTMADLSLPDNTIIYGLSVDIAPSCTDQSESTDVYTGGLRGAATHASAAKFQLSFQTANQTGATSESLNFKTGFHSVNIAQPQNASVNESWASILD